MTAALAALAALILIGLGLAFELRGEGWIMVFAYWQICLFGLLLVAVAVLKGFSKMLLFLLPIFLLPLGLGAGFLVECSKGNCL